MSIQCNCRYGMTQISLVDEATGKETGSIVLPKETTTWEFSNLKPGRWYTVEVRMLKDQTVPNPNVQGNILTERFKTGRNQDFNI